MQEARRFAACEEVVSLVKAGTLKADLIGNIELPARWTWLTPNGHVYQAQSHGATLAILFPTTADVLYVDCGNGKTAKKHQIAGYVYCSTALPEDHWFSFAGLDDVKVWNAVAHRPHWFYAEPFYS